MSAEEIALAARMEFAQKHPDVVWLLPPADALISDCQRLGLALPRLSPTNAYRKDLSAFIETADGERPFQQLVTLSEAAARDHSTMEAERRTLPSEYLKQANERFATRRETAPVLEHPLTEILRASATAPKNVRSLLREKNWARDLAGVAEHWERSERGAAALHLLDSDRHDDPLSALRFSIERPLGSLSALWPDVRMCVMVQHDDPSDPARFGRPTEPPPTYYGLRLQAKPPSQPIARSLEYRGPLALPLHHCDGDDKIRDYTPRLVAAVLWLKAALRRGETLELLEASGRRRLVVTDLRGLMAEVTAWTVPAGPPVLNATLLVQWQSHPSECVSGSVTTLKLRYADEVTFPKTLWLGSDHNLFRLDLRDPSGLLDWEPINASEQARIRADDAARAADDDDDDGGGNPNYPSTTGRPSGGGRGNTPR